MKGKLLGLALTVSALIATSCGDRKAPRPGAKGAPEALAPTIARRMMQERQRESVKPGARTDGGTNSSHRSHVAARRALERMEAVASTEPPAGEAAGGARPDLPPAPPSAEFATASTNATDAAAETVAVDPAHAPVWVWQYARVVDQCVTLDLVVERNAAVGAPNGIVLTQRVPPGWEVESSYPPIQSSDAGARVVQWILADSSLTDGHLVVVMAPAAGAEDAAWKGGGAWYTFRQADGSVGRVAAAKHPDSPAAP